MSATQTAPATTAPTSIPGPPPPLQLSDSAVRRIKAVRAADNDPTLQLRLTVDGGGCAGFKYAFAFDHDAQPDDVVVEKNGARLVTDPMSLLYIAGSMVDYIEELAGAQFAITNPNAKSSCSCGTSFSIG